MSNINDESQESIQWVSMSYAAKVAKVSLNKISKLVKNKTIKFDTIPQDDRIKLVDLDEVKRYFKIL